MATLAAGLAACAGTPPQGSPSRHFSDLRLGGPAAPAPSSVAPTAPTDAAPTVLADAAEVERRVHAYLGAQGFVAEDSREGAVRLVTATRMAEPRRLDDEAACTLQALRRPTFSAANLTVRLVPAPAGVEVGVQSSFAEVNTNLLSGSLVRESCRSRGVLERGVRQAAQGG